MKSTSELNHISEIIIGVAISVHREFGPGVFEKVYETFLQHGLIQAGLIVERQKSMSITHNGYTIERAYRLDLLVEEAIIVEVKAVEALQDVHSAQVLSYLRLSGYPLGLLMNFHAATLKGGLKRFVLTK